jgi:hypothetical protein
VDAELGSFYNREFLVGFELVQVSSMFSFSVLGLQHEQQHDHAMLPELYEAP